MKRLRSLDVYRGLTVAGMVLVNSSGSDEVYAPLRHSVWNGWTPTDLIFPSFLVIMGVSAAFSAAAREARGAASVAAAPRVLMRAAVLIGLGLLENAFIYHGTGGVRFPGVLQRIALCYLGVEAFLFLRRPGVEPAAAAGLLLVYWILLMKVPVPGHGAGVLTPEGNLSYWIDRRLFPGHLMISPWGDPEGLLATLPALATSLLGLIAGRALVKEGAQTARRLGEWGLGLAALGALWSTILPLNKHLWTSSFALFTGGLALAGLAGCLLLIEGRPANWARHFEALGRHALIVYLMAGFFYGVQEYVSVTLPGGSEGNIKLWLTARLFAPWMTAKAASLTYAGIYTVAIATAASLVAQRFDRRKQ
ncbi:MAG: heparan-alpha-glucosaminide N-acetyltransferase domain-containing protein [Elusimicrobia bacterium]|nr:heparan-alpha-glucosaminide N-acetyltransferase domain-containing protein [Elusimicrobiota bacterium]